MTDQGGESSFCQSIYIKIDIRIDMSISLRPVTTKFDKQVHLAELTKMRLIKYVLVTSPCQYHVTNLKHVISTARVPLATKHGRVVTYFDELLSIKAYNPLVTWPCKIHYHTMATKPGTMVTNVKWLLPVMLFYPLVMWFCKIMWQTKTISSLPQCLSPPNLPRLLHAMKGFLHNVRRSFDHGHVTN